MSSGTTETLPDFSRGSVYTLPIRIGRDNDGKTQFSSTFTTVG
jgi:hypothetical protein